MVQFKNYKWLFCALLLGITTHLSAMGFFTIGPGERVQFANGNLQYNYTTSSYQLAPNQYTFIGEDNATAKKNSEGIRDLFQWSELAAITAAGYGVLTKDEWHYLFYYRPHAYSLFALSIVDGVKGVVILPDYDIWTKPDGVPPFDFYNTGEGYEKNQYTAAQWALMEEAGALFLPAAGYMYYNNPSYVVEDYSGYVHPTLGPSAHGSYWSNTEDLDKAGNAFRVQFDDGTGAHFYELKSMEKERFYSVRTVGDAPLLLSENDYPTAFETKMTTARGQSDIWVQRTLRKVGSLNTLTLPFNVPDISTSPLKGAEVYQFSNATVENNKLYLEITKVTTLAAGQPYLIQWPNTGDTIKALHFNVAPEDWDIDNNAENVVGANVTFHGFYGRDHIEDTPGGGVEHAYLFIGANNKLYWPVVDDKTDMYGFRAYFEVTLAGGGSSGMRRRAKQSSGIYKGMPAEFRIVEQVNTATGIELTTTDDPLPTTKKVFRNGQLVIIRDNTEYNISGQIIKQND